ncbi:MAG: hypothetical protein GXO21_04265 [Aquificae bacterium]|nr:hypothetical protein [Aquificota bacterium]
MITATIFETIETYKKIIKQIEEGRIDPFEVEFESLKELVGDNIFTNGLIISFLSKLLKLKAEYLEKQIIPQTEEEKKEAVKSIFKQVLQEETGLEDDDIEALLMVDSIKEKLKKPKAVKPKKISYQEFQEIAKSQIREVLHEDTDYNTYALKIAKQIEKGTFKIKSYKDFIGLMFAIYLFNLEINDIKAFL